MTNSSESIWIGTSEFNPVLGAVGSGGTSVTLRPQSQRVLEILVSAKGEVVTKARLMDEVWADTFVTDDSLVQCVSEIRKALGDDAGLLKPSRTRVTV